MKLKIYAVVMTVLFVIAAFTVGYLMINGDEPDNQNTVEGDHYKARTLAINGWNNTMMKLDYDSDIVFFGDSHTSRSDFRTFFPDKKIVTLGCPGDTLYGMQKRVKSITAMTPEKVFVLGGENGLNSGNVDESIEQYEKLIRMMLKQMPDVQIVIVSALPVREDNSLGFCNNDVINSFNKNLKPLAEKLGCDYVDIHDLYIDDNGELEKSLTADGVHLRPEAYDRWAEAIRMYVG